MVHLAPWIVRYLSNIDCIVFVHYLPRQTDKLWFNVRNTDKAYNDDDNDNDDDDDDDDGGDDDDDDGDADDEDEDDGDGDADARQAIDAADDHVY